MTEPVFCEFQPEKRIQGVELSEPGRGAGQQPGSACLVRQGRVAFAQG